VVLVLVASRFWLCRNEGEPLTSASSSVLRRLMGVLCYHTQTVKQEEAAERE
jgi:hypothetical protein